MKIFDAQVRSDTRTDDELRNLHYFETERIVTTSHDPQRFELASDLLTYFDELLSTEADRIRRSGLIPHVALGVLPRARPRRAHYEVWRELPRMLAQPDVVAVGEIGAWEDTASHWELFDTQARIALEAGLPVICTPPRALPVNMTYKMAHRLQAVGMRPSMCMMNRLDERMAETMLAEGYVAGISVGYPQTDPRAAAATVAHLLQALGSSERIVLNSALRRGAADVLGVPKTIMALQDRGVATDVIEQLVYENAARLFLTSAT